MFGVDKMLDTVFGTCVVVDNLHTAEHVVTVSSIHAAGIFQISKKARLEFCVDTASMTQSVLGPA